MTTQTQAPDPNTPPTHNPSFITTEIPLSYHLKYKEPQQRNFRFREVSERVRIRVDVATEEQAPVVLIRPETTGKRARPAQDYRFYRGELIRLALNEQTPYTVAEAAAKLRPPYHRDQTESFSFESAEDAAAYVTREMEKYVLIGGRLYVPAAEPVYTYNEDRIHDPVKIEELDEHGQVNTSAYEHTHALRADEFSAVEALVREQPLQRGETPERRAETLKAIQSLRMTVLRPDLLRFGTLHAYTFRSELELTVTQTVLAPYAAQARRQATAEFHDLGASLVRTNVAGYPPYFHLTHDPVSVTAPEAFTPQVLTLPGDLRVTTQADSLSVEWNSERVRLPISAPSPLTTSLGCVAALLTLADGDLPTSLEDRLALLRGASPQGVARACLVVENNAFALAQRAARGLIAPETSRHLLELISAALTGTPGPDLDPRRS